MKNRSYFTQSPEKLTFEIYYNDAMLTLATLMLKSYSNRTVLLRINPFFLSKEKLQINEKKNCHKDSDQSKKIPDYTVNFS